MGWEDLIREEQSNKEWEIEVEGEWNEGDNQGNRE